MSILRSQVARDYPGKPQGREAHLPVPQAHIMSFRLKKPLSGTQYATATLLPATSKERWLP
ncbi:MAG TPA: hypothetical protein VH575_03510 [Gemmataceae bacterium]|jgi:hypothetical protein